MPSMESREARARLWRARVGRLATVRPEGTPHIVPVVFVTEGDRVVIPIDHKPKSTRDLQRLRNIESNPTASLLVDHYGDDWSTLWWVRVDGRAEIHDESVLLEELQSKYKEYADFPPEGPFIVIAIEKLSGWSAS